MIKQVIIFIFILASSCASAQADLYKIVQEHQLNAEYCELDQLNNLYVVKKGQVLKFDPDGVELNRFSDKRIGETVLLDVNNPMKVLLYSADQMMLYTLDSRLGELSERINWFESGYEQISLVATSHSNGMWLYDPINFVLIRLNEKLEEQARSLSLSQLLRQELNPTDLIEVNNKVYLTDPNHGVMEFDVFGNYLRNIPIQGIDRLVVNDNRLFYTENQKLEAFNLYDGTIEHVEVPIEKQETFATNRNRVLVTRQGSVIIYQALR
jgi:hypothetical protein